MEKTNLILDDCQKKFKILFHILLLYNILRIINTYRDLNLSFGISLN